MSKTIPALVAVFALAVSASAAEFHVAPNGSDANPGTADKPFATLAKARDAAKAGDRILLKGGVHRLSETLVLGPQNSGVTWMAAPGETPVLSGGVVVTGWTEDKNGVWMAKFAHAGKLRQLSVNGRSAALAQGPTVKPLGWYGEFVIRGDEPWAAGTAGKAPAGFRFKQADFPVLANSNPADVEFRQLRVWNHHWLCFGGLKLEGGEWCASFAQPAAAAATNMEPWVNLNLGPVTLFNAYEFVDAPGEFYYNTQTQVLYYRPRPGEVLAQAAIVAPMLETLVRIEGASLQQRVSGVRFEGISFADSAYLLAKIGESRGHVTVQANEVHCRVKAKGNLHSDPFPPYTVMDIPAAAVFVANAADVTIHRCEFRNLGCLALTLENDVVTAAVTGNVFSNIEGGGITVGHPQHIYIGKMNGDNRGYGPYNLDNRQDKYNEAREGLCRDFVIANNLFRNVVTAHWGMVPVNVFYGHNFSIVHNDMAELPYSGISIGWGWSEGSPGPNKLYGAGKNWAGNMDGTKPSQSLRNYQVMNNRILGFCEKMHDGGGIYTLAYADVNMKDGQPKLYSRISGNYASTRSTDNHPDHCVYPDEGSCTLEITGNVFDIPTLLQAFQHQARAGKHDLQYHGNYINVAAVSGKEYQNVPPQSVYQDNHYFKPATRPTTQEQWPAEAQKIIENAGLEPAYRDLLEK